MIKIKSVMTIFITFILLSNVLVVCTIAASNGIKSDEKMAKNISDGATPKWITINTPDYGNITLREDMVIREGDSFKIIPNKDYRENGLITPYFEKIPISNFVTVDTPYGPLKVTEETYKKEGKEKISKKYSEYINQHKEIQLFEKTSNINKTTNINDNSTISAVNPVAQQSTLSLSELHLNYERTWFNPMNNQQPTYLYGYINPQTNYNPSADIYIQATMNERYI